MATKTSTSTNISITQRGDIFVVKETKTKTTTSPGKEPDVEVTESVEEYKGRENLPENIRRQLEKKQTNQPINVQATRGNFAEDALREVNKYRKLHGVEPLKLSPQLMKLCETRAKTMAEKGDMLDSNEDDIGESVSCMSSNDPEFYVKAEDVVLRWYSGSEDYNYLTEPEELVAGHFTQMIWKKTKEFGVAAAKSKTNQIFVVACYSPRGNYVNQFVENVCPPAYGGKSIFAGGIPGIVGGNKSKKGTAGKDENGHLNEEGIECHNKYRKAHGVGNLRYSKELSSYAQEWANELARRDILEHRPDGKYGENLYHFRSSDSNAKASSSDACRSWYSEIQSYTFGREPSSTKSGHFTQMVWKDTRELGMGMAKSKSGSQYIVANYNPPGNYVGKYTENVPEPLKFIR